ncbi:hypothetical protein MASR2M78_35450 [Treponema sp.]
MRGWKRISALKILAAGLVMGALSVFIIRGRVFSFLPAFSSLSSSKTFSSSLLADLKAVDLRIHSARPEDWALLSKKLDELEKKTIGLESELSLLKRRRSLSQLSKDPPAYLEAAKRALERFPHSEVLSALLAEAYLALGQKDAALPYAQNLREDRYLPIKAAISLGDLPAKEETFLVASAIYQRAGLGAEAASLRINAVLIRLLSQDILGTLSFLRSSREAGPGIPESEHLLHAELEYDFGDKKAAADLFSFMEGPSFTLRRADALYLASETEKAREAWKTVAADSQARSLQAKALYNLASTDASPEESRSHLQRSLDIDSNDVLSILRLARLLDVENPDEAVLQKKLLEKALSGTDPALVELELLKNRIASDQEKKITADIWILLERYPQDERILEWAAYYFVHTLKLEELDRLLVQERRRVSKSELIQYKALALLREGKLDEAERLLLSLANTGGDWYIAANLGLLAEAKREPALALERYETASSLLNKPRIRAELQLRIARCLSVLGRNTDARRALEYGLDLDSGNRMLRLALRKLGGF